MNEAPGLNILDTPSGRSSAPPAGDETTVGSYFVSNYPPYSFWKSDREHEALAALDRAPDPRTPMGLYLHIPFCRKRCHFCYFKVYTDKSAPEIENYLEAMIDELRLLAAKPLVRDRKPSFVYFGGGTPSYLSSHQLGRLAEAMARLVPWRQADEIAFECEPGTVTEPKLHAIRAMGVTRLSIGIENYDDEILRINGRAHTSKEIEPIFAYARKVGFPQINLDLIAGMVGETEENWRECVRKTVALAPDSVTIYQMEVPHNTTLFKEMRERGEAVAPVANWKTKRAWIRYAFAELERAGYHAGSAYTLVKDPSRAKFLYRDLLWRGADMIGVGVASISHASGVHYQNEHEMGAYLARLREGRLPIYRALAPSAEERMIREFILQMKLGAVAAPYFRDKFGVDIGERFAAPLASLRARGLLHADSGGVSLTRDGLLQVDRLLSEFFLPQHAGPMAA
jgi:oxygen-independent coproporphyrinogen-3 oxidase